MAEIVNLRQARKRKRRSEKESASEANRLTHGQSAEARKQLRQSRDLEERRLEAHRRRRADGRPEDG
jgi:hypothetical protein